VLPGLLPGVPRRRRPSGGGPSWRLAGSGAVAELRGGRPSGQCIAPYPAGSGCRAPGRAVGGSSSRRTTPYLTCVGDLRGQPARQVLCAELSALRGAQEALGRLNGRPVRPSGAAGLVAHGPYPALGCGSNTTPKTPKYARWPTMLSYALYASAHVCDQRLTKSSPARSIASHDAGNAAIVSNDRRRVYKKEKIPRLGSSVPLRNRVLPPPCGARLAGITWASGGSWASGGVGFWGGGLLGVVGL
jgi:hypothetical protein